MERGLVRLTELQKLLNEEAMLSNTGRGDSEERKKIHTMIRLKRTNQPRCFGQDDCATVTLSTCPWRMDCGSDFLPNSGD
jgi:hypothetical protein